MILEVNNISKDYLQGSVEVQALKEISFSVNKGSTLAIVGHSGSGKTTLLSLLAGLDEPTSGKIQLLGKEITSFNEIQLSQFRAENMGIVFQQFHLMPYMTALENISLPLEITKQSNIKERSLEALRKVGLENRAHHKPQELSGGECQRVAIARALVTNPKILLADEPSGNLDTETGHSIMELLFGLVKQNEMTMVLVTHNEEHAKLCHESIKLQAGKII